MTLPTESEAQPQLVMPGNHSVCRIWEWPSPRWATHRPGWGLGFVSAAREGLATVSGLLLQSEDKEWTHDLAALEGRNWRRSLAAQVCPAWQASWCWLPTGGVAVGE